jgi:hypothetical protein
MARFLFNMFVYSYPMWLAAERASISRSTLTKIEKGDEGVSFGAYAKILFILGMIQRLIDLGDAALDALGLQLESEQLPKRIRLPKHMGR